VVSTKGRTKGSLIIVVKPMVKPMIQSFMVQLVAQSQFEPMVDNNDNICVVNGFYLIKNLVVVCNGI